MLASEGGVEFANIHSLLFVSINHFVPFDEIASKPLLLNHYLDIELELTREFNVARLSFSGRSAYWL